MTQLNLTNRDLNGSAVASPPDPFPAPANFDLSPQDALKRLEFDLAVANQRLEAAEAAEVVQWAAEQFGNRLVMTTSFGIQSAVMLHLVTQVIPEIPVIWIDTGYLPAETYQFVEQLSQQLNLNLQVYQSAMSPARMEALHGRLWESDDVESLTLYNQIRKVEPMQRALADFQARAWLAGLRRDQTDFRKNLAPVTEQNGVYKVLPILNWTAKDIYYYLQDNGLPYHPLFDQGYTTVGDWHSSRPMSLEDEHERDTRFRGLKQECGLHLPQTIGEAQSLDSSSL